MGLDECIMTLIRHCSIIQNSLTASEVLCVSEEAGTQLITIQLGQCGSRDMRKECLGIKEG